MGIRIEEQLIVLNEKNYKFNSVNIRRHPLQGMLAVVTFDLLDSSGASKAQEKIVYRGAEYNTFWDHFNSGTFLYSELITKKNLQAALDDTLEAEFKNT